MCFTPQSILGASLYFPRINLSSRVLSQSFSWFSWSVQSRVLSQSFSWFSWSVHIEKITKKIASGIGALKRVRSFITTKTAVQIYQALMQPHFDYCCSVWDNLGETLSNKMQKLQNRAARVITRSPYDASANPLLDSLHLDNLSLRRKKIKAKIMFKILKGDAPAYLQNLFSARGTGYDLRNSK